MDSEAILGLYQWKPGACFQCARNGVDTTVIDVLFPKDGDRQEIRACRVCVLILEGERQQDARRRGEPYEPGHVGPL